MSEMVECSGKSCTLIKKLLDNKSLHCCSCKKLLRIPVILVDGVGNVCENCALKNEWRGTRNEIFNVLLQELTVPCANVNVGCSEEIAHEHFEEHLKICLFRPVKCPYEDCTSMEIQNKLSNHFLENHKEDVIESDTFNFQLNHQEPPDHFTKFLVKRHSSFLFDVKLDADELVCTLFKFHKNAPRATTITFCNAKGRKCSFKIDINPLDLIDRKCSGEKVNLTILKTMFQDVDVLSMIVDIPPSDSTLHSLKCPICDELMGPPIFLCKTGHTLCKNCVGKLKKCPMCSATISKDIRNYHLEHSTSDILYSCINKSLGCCAILSGDEIMDHESNCSYHLYKCPLDCQFQYNSETILNHLSAKHASVTNKFEFDLRYNDAEKFMYIDGRFFRFQYVLNPATKPKDNLDWTKLKLKLLNSNRQVKDLFCKVTMTNLEAHARVTQLWFFPSIEQKCYSLSIPIQSWGLSIDPTRNNEHKAQLQFKCELFMKKDI